MKKDGLERFGALGTDDMKIVIAIVGEVESVTNCKFVIL